MTNQEQYRNEHGYRLIRLCSTKSGSQIDLLQRQDGSHLICRTYDHPVPAYEALVGHRCEALPQVYGYRELDGGCVVEEEFVDGLQLSQVMECHALETDQVCAIVSQICRALALLHEKDLVHRDVKPENILITSAGRVVLLDLDAAGKQSGTEERDTQLLGTVGYAAPEQFGFGRSDRRTDIFSVGILMNVMLTGQHPSRVLAEGPLRPIIETCVQMNADKRFATVQELQRRLPRYGRQEVCPLCGFRSPGGGCIYCGKLPARRKKPWWLLAAVLCAAAVLAGTLLLRPKPTEPDVPPVRETMETEQKTEQEETPPVIREEEQPQQPEQEELLPEPLVPAGTPVAAEDRYPLADYRVPEDLVTAAFTLPELGEFHLSVGMLHMQVVTSHNSWSPVLETAARESVGMGAMFWTAREDGTFLPVDDKATLDAIYAAMGDTLTIQMQPIEDMGALPQNYPIVWQGDLPAAMRLELGHDVLGSWLFTVEGSVGEQLLQAQTILQWLPKEAVVWTPETGSDVVVQINQYLQQVQVTEDQVLQLQLPAGELQGEILLPERLYNTRVELHGAWNEESGKPETVLRGGVNCQIMDITVYSVHFVGAGADVPAWEDGRVNSALLGDGGGAYRSCVFEDYDSAVRNTGRIKVGSNSLFRNNRVGVLLQSASGSGGPVDWSGNRYENNGIAIWVAALNEGKPGDSWDLSGSAFTENGVDVRCDLGRSFYVTDCWFDRGGILEGLVQTDPQRSVKPQF